LTELKKTHFKKLIASEFALAISLFFVCIGGYSFSFSHSIYHIGIFGTLLSLLIIALLLKKEKRRNEQEKNAYADRILKSEKIISSQKIELKNAYNEIASLAITLEKVRYITESLSETVREREEVFLEQLTKMLSEIIPDATYGRTYLFENGAWKLAKNPSFRGNVMPLSHDLAINTTSTTRLEKPNPLIFKANPEDEEDPFPQSLRINLKIGDTLVGRVFLDNASSPTGMFSDEDRRMAQCFSYIASGHLGMRKFIVSEGKMQKHLVLSLIKILEFYSVYTRGHSQKVAELSAKTAQALGFSSKGISRIYWAGLVHDIGKILIPSTILEKSSPLTPEEFEKIKLHPVWGAEVLGNSEEIRDTSLAVKYHHERWDGKGYPEGLEGDNIPVSARIISVADAYEAMTSDRPYKKGVSFEEAIEEIKINSGTQFDPAIASIFIRVISQSMLQQSSILDA
jgi:HD-GYP domain-containing protein (c-di-GMP phosphodiesterase class II)